MRVALSHVGCKLNQAEIEALARAFAAAGHEVVTDLACADVHVVNTCTVTAEAARDSRRLARRGGRAGRPLPTVVTGCHATTSPEEMARIPGVALVVNNSDKQRLVEVVERHLLQVAPPAPQPASMPAPGRTRAAVKIQDGCSVGCTFCTVPRARGPAHSRPGSEVLAEVSRLVAGGAQELVLTGVLISSYRSAGVDLPGLVEAILTRLPLRRLRLSSLSPWAIGPRELAMWSHPRLCRHVHLSLQSGCAATLRRMQRPCTPEQFAAAVGRLRAAIPGVAITTDVIVGFPGETDEEFQESLAFVTALGFARTHVFGFSPRPGTAAATLPGQLPAGLIRGRVAAMRAAAAAGQGAFVAGYVGQRVEVLWEGERGGWREGHTDTYVTVRVPAANLEADRWGWVEVERVDGGVAWGRPVAPAGEASLAV